MRHMASLFFFCSLSYCCRRSNQMHHRPFPLSPFPLLSGATHIMALYSSFYLSFARSLFAPAPLSRSHKNLTTKAGHGSLTQPNPRPLFLSALLWPRLLPTASCGRARKRERPRECVSTQQSSVRTKKEMGESRLFTKYLAQHVRVA